MPPESGADPCALPCPPVLIQDLFRLATVSDPQLHPDGGRVAFVVSRMNEADDRYDRRIWLWDGRRAVAFSAGPGDRRPRWSPDGARLAFLRQPAGDDSVAQVAVMAADGGEAHLVSDFALGATEAEWAPDGSELAVIGTVWTDEWADLDDEARTRRPRRIRRFGYRFDSLGWRHDRRSNVYLVDPEGAGPSRALSGGDVHDTGVVWRPDGAAVGFLSARHPQRGMDGGNQPWEVPRPGGEPVPLSGVGMWHVLSYRPDGTPFAVGIDDPWDYPGTFGLWQLGGDGPVRVAPHLDRSVTSHTPRVDPPGPQWIDGNRCLTVVEDAGRLSVAVIEDDGTVRPLAGGDRQIHGVSPRSDGSAFAFAATAPPDPGELWWWEGGEERRLTSLNESTGLEFVTPDHFRFERDGEEIDAWVYLPPGDDPVPALLNVHGGPNTQYGFGFFDEFQVYAGAGFGVVACNPRGSSGRGRAFARVPVDRWVEDRPPDMEDLLAALDAALERHPRLDGDRLGVMGGSFGGFMTARIVAAEDRFRSAVPERGLYGFTSFHGTSDIGYRFPRMYLTELGPDPWDRLHAAGVLARAHRIGTPTLIIHSEQDLRCPIEQAEQLFTLLAAGGIETELLRFPGGSHELSRSGRPSHRKARFEAILAWHARHLAPPATDVTT